jgi:hypothetical protein
MFFCFNARPKPCPWLSLMPLPPARCCRVCLILKSGERLWLCSDRCLSRRLKIRLPCLWPISNSPSSLLTPSLVKIQMIGARCVRRLLEVDLWVAGYPLPSSLPRNMEGGLDCLRLLLYAATCRSCRRDHQAPRACNGSTLARDLCCKVLSNRLMLLWQANKASRIHCFRFPSSQSPHNLYHGDSWTHLMVRHDDWWRRIIHLSHAVP